MNHDADWDMLSNPDVQCKLEQAAHRVARQYPRIPIEDFMQEGAFVIAANGEHVRRYLTNEGQGLGWVYSWLHSRLIDFARHEYRFYGHESSLTPYLERETQS